MDKLAGLPMRPLGEPVVGRGLTPPVLDGPISTALTLPPPRPVDEAAYAVLVDLVAQGGVLVLTGAGMSTASGIPDYRGPDGQRRVQPMQHAEFVGSAAGRQRYWARAFTGWERFAAARPNSAHAAVAAVQRAGLVEGIITQNVDGLHQQAGARDVLELHGNLDRVVCLDCEEPYRREQVHTWLQQANPDFTAGVEEGQVRPDGDVVLDEELVRGFRAPRCLVCSGDRLKPDVVFFGGSVPRPLVQESFALLERSRMLLVLGSSLRVMSGYRFVRRAARDGMPIAVVTRGETRGQGEPTVQLDSLLDDVLPRLVTDLGAGPLAVDTAS